MADGPGCRDIVTRGWDCAVKGTPMFTTTKKLKRCKQMLKLGIGIILAMSKKALKSSKSNCGRQKRSKLGLVAI